jgi:hypothetical protein
MYFNLHISRRPRRREECRRLETKRAEVAAVCGGGAIANAARTFTRRNGTIESERQNNGRPSFLKAFPVDGLLNYTNDINSCARVHSCECIPSQPAATNKGAG